jgi:hypothetical protein
MSVLEQIRQASKTCWRVLSRRSDAPQIDHSSGLGWRVDSNYQAYLVRFWRSNTAMPWRAAVVDPRRDVVHYFATREALYAFLDAQIDNHEPGVEQNRRG